MPAGRSFISTSVWDFVIDELLINLNNAGYYTLGYADEVPIVIMGKNASTEGV